MARRSNGEGTIGRRADGRWSARLVYTDQDGKSRRQEFYGKTKTEAWGKLTEARKRLAAGAPVKDSSVTLGAYAGRWLTSTLPASGRKLSTRSTYATLARLHIIGSPIGAQRLDRLAASDVETLVLGMSESGKAPSTIRQTYTVLRAILDAAVRDGLVGRNVAALVSRPGVPRTEAQHLDRDRLRALLAETDKSARYGVLFRLLAATGMRKGEAIALRWQDVDLDEGTLRVRLTAGTVEGELQVTEPKTARSRRSIPLAPGMVALLRQHRADQAGERLRQGAAWRDRGLVFTGPTGDYLDPRNTLRALTTAAHRAGISGVGVHTLRHSAATMMLGAGVPLTDVSAILGHASVSITADVYGHPTAGGARAAVERMAEALG